MAGIRHLLLDDLLAAQLDAESNYDVTLPQDHPRNQAAALAVSSQDAYGPAQFLKNTWDDYGDGGDITNIDDARAAQLKYLGYISDYLFEPDGSMPHQSWGHLTGDLPEQDRVDLALAAYNYGPPRARQLLSKYGQRWRDQLPEETSTYIERINERRNYPRYRALVEEAAMDDADEDYWLGVVGDSGMTFDDSEDLNDWVSHKREKAWQTSSDPLYERRMAMEFGARPLDERDRDSIEVLPVPVPEPEVLKEHRIKRVRGPRAVDVAQIPDPNTLASVAPYQRPERRRRRIHGGRRR